MPFAGFPDFKSCTKSMMEKQGYTEEIANKVCGALQAKAERKHSEPNNNSMRELRAKISFGQYQNVDDGLLVKDVKLLASGTWTDSHMGTPLYYPEAILERYASNWMDNSLWSRHGGGIPRSITDKIGEIRNPRYNGGAVIGDLWLHEKTQTSRDTAELIKAGLVDYVSVEHGGKERWNQKEQRYDAEEIVFGGVAVVNKGACKVCTIHNETGTEDEIVQISHSWHLPSNNQGVDNQTMTKEDSAADPKGTAAEREAELRALQAQVSEVKKSDLQALEAQLEEAKKNITHSLSAQLAGAGQRIAELEMENKELLRKLHDFEHNSKIKELQAEIAKLSVEPVYHTKITGTVAAQPRELELDNEEFPAFTAKDFGE